MHDDLIRRQLDATLSETRFAGVGTHYRGKVRDTYAHGDRIFLVTTDRISAFDHILRQTIPFKGQVLNRLAAYFFDRTRDVCPNHVLAVPDANLTVGANCVPVPVEFVVRGYLAGHAWRTYRAGGRELCGEALPEGLRENSRLPEPILTPATKADQGHDEDIAAAELVAQGILDGPDFDLLRDYAFALFERGTRMAAEQGLILVDTKYEFGRRQDGSFVVIDEIHTPDSSRYFHADTYEHLLAQDKPQRQLSKEFVREWLMEKGFRGLEGQRLPDLDDEFRIEVSARYIELFERITGEAFVPDAHPDPASRVRAAISGYLPG